MKLDPILMCVRCQAARVHIFVERRARRRVPGELAFVGTADDLAAAIRRASGVAPRHVSQWATRFSTDESGRLLLRAIDKAIASRKETS